MPHQRLRRYLPTEADALLYQAVPRPRAASPAMLPPTFRRGLALPPSPAPSSASIRFSAGAPTISWDVRMRPTGGRSLRLFDHRAFECRGGIDEAVAVAAFCPLQAELAVLQALCPYTISTVQTTSARAAAAKALRAKTAVAVARAVHLVIVRSPCVR